MLHRYLLAPLAALLLAAPRLAQAQTGAVGIGTTAPDASAALDIVSSAKGALLPRLTQAQVAAIARPATGLLVFQTDGTSGFYYNNGTAIAPNWQQLATAGTGNADNLGNHTATQNLNLAGNALVGTGANVGTAVGVGIRADGGLNLGQNTAGQNLLLGYQAGQALTPDAGAGAGLYNQLVGYQSGAATTTGTANVFGGYQSGFSNTTGTGNQFVGYQAGYSNTTGEGNVFGGFSSGYSNTIGHSNVFAGTRSGYSNTEGNNNQFVGDNAGAGNLTGSNNSFGGYGSGLTNTTGSNNLFAGYLSGSLNTTGSSNTVLGASSGPDLSHPDLTNATALGANVALTQSNTVVLGNGASVGIGTSTPSQRLEVAGTIFSSAGGFRFPDGTTQTTAATAPNLTGDITSTGAATSYNNVVPATKGGAGAVTGILKANGSGTVSAAAAADFPTLNQSTTGNAATATAATTAGSATTATYATTAGNATTVTTNANLTGDITSAGNTTTYSSVVPAAKGGAGTLSGILKANGTGTVSQAVAGTDYLTPAAASTGFIQNGTTPQAGSSFNISGAGTVGGQLVAGSATINGTTAVTGATTLTGTTSINTSGSASTRLGNGTGAVILPGLSTAGFVTNSAGGQLGTTTAASLGTNFILNQGNQQTGATFNVSGAGTVGGAFTAGTAAVTGTATVGGSLGVGTSTPAGQLANTASNVIATDGNGISQQGLGWVNTSSVGYAGIFYNANNAASGPGLAVKVASASAAALDVSQGSSQGTAGTSLLRVNGNGTVGIGTAAPQAGLHLTSGNGGPGTGTNTAGALLSGAPGQPPYLELRGSGTGSSTTTPYIDFAEASDQDYTTRLISQGGTLNVSGAGANGQLLQVNGGLRATSYANLSDARFKQHVRPIGSALASVLALRGVRYEWNALGIKHGGTAGAGQVGVIAQEIEKIYPELVTTDQDGYKAVNYAQLTPVLIEALKEQQAQIEALKVRAAAAEADHASLLTLQAQVARLLGEAPTARTAR